ncbi:hypothetical protein B0T10DRAFT_487017 [Thelonectria olida]|uniref:Uncharacterized protein n=1 Tax=Thelonectria olida TaxID=1576542 RepID=A0A9P9AQ67_9HYPO|nr:hypothetical protein B0T10DRAFT_487017 [Thelonectria olida]
MSHHKAYDTKPFWLIQPRLDANEYRDKLIGSVVKYPGLPTERRIPYRYKKQPRELVSDLDPKPIQVRNVKFWQRRIKDARVSASVNEILEGFVERAKEDSNENTATVARLWHMDSPSQKFKELLKNKQYFEELFDLLRDNHDQGYFITEIVTLVNLESSSESGRSKGAGASAKVPLDPNTGVRVGAGGHVGVMHESGRSATYEEETIVFLGYRLVRLEKVDSKRAKLGRMFLGPKHGFAVMEGSDYWPTMVEKPVEGNAEPFMGDPPKPPELSAEEMELNAIMVELGFDVEVVG